MINHQKNRVKTTSLDNIVLGIEEDHETDYEMETISKIMTTGFQSLNPKDRVLIREYFILKKPERELAEKYHVHISTISRRLHKICDKLSSILIDLAQTEFDIGERDIKNMLMSIPSPSSGSLDLGPITLRMYGFMIALGVIAAVWLMGKRFMSKGINPDHASGLAMWIVPAGIIGARAYHVITDWRRFEGNWGEAVQIWRGGLGILGGVIFGLVAAFFYCRKHELDIKEVMDGVAPALALA